MDCLARCACDVRGGLLSKPSQSENTYDNTCSQTVVKGLDKAFLKPCACQEIQTQVHRIHQSHGFIQPVQNFAKTIQNTKCFHSDGSFSSQAFLILLVSLRVCCCRHLRDEARPVSQLWHCATWRSLSAAEDHWRPYLGHAMSIFQWVSQGCHLKLIVPYRILLRLLLSSESVSL